MNKINDDISNFKVRSDGECIEARECPVCSDESGYGRKSGEQWHCANEPCVVAICQPDGTIAQSSVVCAAAPTCGPNEVKTWRFLRDFAFRV